MSDFSFNIPFYSYAMSGTVATCSASYMITGITHYPYAANTTALNPPVPRVVPVPPSEPEAIEFPDPPPDPTILAKRRFTFA